MYSLLKYIKELKNNQLRRDSMDKQQFLSAQHISWYKRLQFQIPMTILVLFTLLTSAIVFTLISVNARQHDYAILNLSGQLRVIANNLQNQSKQYKANAPRDYPSYFRDLKLYHRQLNDQINHYDEIIQAFKKREIGTELTGLESDLSCNWDQQSINQLDQTVIEWENFKSGLKLALGSDKQEPRLEYAAEFIIKQAISLNQSTDALTTSFRSMMQTKLDNLILTVKGLLLLSAIISVGILVLFYLRIQKPLNINIRGINQISNGELQHRIHTRDESELSVLSHTINNMATSLNAIFKLTSDVNSTNTVDETLQTVYREFNMISPINWAGIFSVNANRTRIKLDRMFSDVDSHLNEGTEFDYIGSYMANLLNENEITIIDNIAEITDQYPHSAISKLHTADKLNSALLLPLTTSFKDDSVIVFASHELNAFDSSKSGLIRFIGDQLNHSFEKNVVMENLVISAVEGMAKLAESRDPETGDHLLRMSIYSSIITQQLRRNSPYAPQIDNRYIRDILRFAPMHDIGKVGIEDNILLKPGRLTDEERNIMQQHPIIGGDVLRRCEAQMNQVGLSIFKTGIEIADAHHEKYDGSGYPNLLRGTDIPLAARIVAVADVFDALTSRRPYKDAWSVEKALQLLAEESGHHFDPVVVNAFNESIDEIMEIYHKYKHV